MICWKKPVFGLLIGFGLVLAETGEKSFFLRRRLQLSSTDAFDLRDVNSADHYLGFCLYGKLLKYPLVSNQGHNSGTYFSFYNGNLCPEHVLWRFVDYHFGKSGIFHFQFLLVDHQHGHNLLSGLQHGLLFILLLFQSPSQEIHHYQKD